jgi:hypothetical protein
VNTIFLEKKILIFFPSVNSNNFVDFLGKNCLELYHKIEGKTCPPHPPRRKKEKIPTFGTGEDSSKFVINTKVAHNGVNSVTPDEHSSECGGQNENQMFPKFSQQQLVVFAPNTSIHA